MTDLRALVDSLSPVELRSLRGMINAKLSHLTPRKLSPDHQRKMQEGRKKPR